MEKSDKNTPLWDSALPIEKRLDYLIGELTLEEKIACMGTGNPAIPRLGIQEFHVGGEAAHGVQARHDQAFDKGEPDLTTSFPNPIGMSATWDEDLIRQAGEVVGTEARALFSREQKGSLSLWAPTVDMERDPRWGRTEEAYGEDPLLTGRMAGAYVEGLQGDDAFYLRTAATLKHFYANNTEEGRVWKSSSIDARNKWEYYLEPFRQLTKEHGAEALMTSYNEINGVPAILNPEVARLLKDKWGLHHVVCDGGDMSQTVNFHHYYESHTDTVVAGLAAGVDCFTDDEEIVTNAFRTALKQNKISEKDLDRALRCHFGTLIRLGLFDGAGENPYADISEKQVGLAKHRRIARAVATEGIVLLQNMPTEQDAASEKLLPLDLSKKIAVVGPLADVYYKDWYGGIAPCQVTPIQGLEEVCGCRVESVATDTPWDGQHMLFEKGLSQVRIRVGDEMYLGLDGNCAVCRCDREHAEVFEIECWDGVQITLRACSNGKLLTLEDDYGKGQEGHVTATSEEAFGWFVREVFRFWENEEGKEAVTEEDGISVNGILASWNKRQFYFDAQDRLCVVRDEEKEKTVADTEREASAGEPVPYAGLSVWLEMVYDGINAAAELAAKADTVLLFLGANPMITCKEEIDRQDLRLPPYQSKLMRKVYAANPNVALVLVTNVPFGIDWAKKNIPAIVVSATGGMDLGNALADVLVGNESPAGRLPMTWYSVNEKLPDMDDYDIIQGERTYLYFRGKPLYPFGHGMTYGEIQYDTLSVKVCAENRTAGNNGNPDAVLDVSLRLCNTGNCMTDEVVQIYGRKIDSALKRPRRQLLDFVRVKALKPAESREVTLRIPVERLQYYEVIQEKMLLEDGMYEILAGSSSEDLPLRACVRLDGQERGWRMCGKQFWAEQYDASEHAVLVEGFSRGSESAVWLPDTTYSFVAPIKGERLRLVYDRLEIPKEGTLYLEMTVREEGAWTATVALGGMWQAQFSGNASGREKQTAAEKPPVCRHPDGTGKPLKTYRLRLDAASSEEKQEECAENRLLIQVSGEVALAHMRLIDTEQ